MIISNILVNGAPIDPYGYTVSVFDPDAVDEPAALTATSGLTLTGTTRVGATLTSVGPTWSEPAVQTTYRWLRDGAEIPGAIGDRLVLGALDVGRRISVEAIGSKPGFTSTTLTSAPTGPVAKIAATLTLTGRSTALGNLQIDAAVATDEPLPGGTVTVREGSAVVGSAVAVINGRAAFRASGVKPGSHTYTVTYSGSARVQSTSAAVRVTVLAKTPGILTLVGSSPAVGKTKIKITVTAVGEGPLSGKVTVKEGSTLLKTLIVIKGQATFEASNIKPGRHTYTVAFGGTSRVTAVTKTVSVQVKAKTASTTSLTGSSPVANDIKIGIAVAAPGHGGLGGTAKVQEASKTLKSGIKIIGGKATITASGIKPGNHTYKVTYSGTSEVNGSSKSVTIDVKKPVTLKSFADCTAMRRDHPHGVGRTNATDQTSGTPVTNFLRHNALYSYNDGKDRRSGEKDLDRDNDGIACESR